MEQKKLKTSKAVILFADIIGSADLANNLSLIKYYEDILLSFYNLSNEIIKKSKIKEWMEDCKVDYTSSCRGDEVCLIFYLQEKLNDDEETSVLKELIVRIVNFARELKIGWFLVEYNRNRIKQQKRPVDIGIGINVGDVIIDNKYKETKIEGFSITLAKRVESSSHEKGLYTRIMLSRSAYQLALQAGLRVHWGEHVKQPRKGFLQVEMIYEIKNFFGLVYWNFIGQLAKDTSQCEIIFNIDYSNTWIGLEIARYYYYRRNFQKVLEILKKILLVDKKNIAASCLIGVCYGQLGIEEKDIFLMKKGTKYLEVAHDLDSYNEDILIELGILQINIYNIFYKNSLPVPEEGKSYVVNGFDCFLKATELSINNSRSVFWVFRISYEYDISELKLLEMLYSVGYLSKKIKEEEDFNKILAVIESLFRDYLKCIFLPNYRANVYSYIAVAYYDGLSKFFSSQKDKMVNKAKKYMEDAIKEADSLITSKSKIELPDGIYTSNQEISRICSAEDFKKTCQELLKFMNSGKESLLEKKPPENLYNLWGKKIE